jgi:hypothetical protein
MRERTTDSGALRSAVATLDDVPPGDGPTAEREDDDKGIGENLRGAADKVKDAITPDDRER